MDATALQLENLRKIIIRNILNILRLFIYLFVYLFICLFVSCLFIYLSIYLFNDTLTHFYNDMSSPRITISKRTMHWFW